MTVRGLYNIMNYRVQSFINCTVLYVYHSVQLFTMCAKVHCVYNMYKCTTVHDSTMYMHVSVYNR